MRRYRLISRLYMERFGEAALLLVAEQNLLLTVNVAAANLFEALMETFAGRSFTREDGVRWLNEHYELPRTACCRRVRELLAFGLRHRLVRPDELGGAEKIGVDVND